MADENDAKNIFAKVHDISFVIVAAFLQNQQFSVMPGRLGLNEYY